MCGCVLQTLWINPQRYIIRQKCGTKQTETRDNLQLTNQTMADVKRPENSAGGTQAG